jgi:hypothetical protein
MLQSYIPSSPILVTLVIEAIRSSESSNLTRDTWHNIPEDGIFQHIINTDGIWQNIRNINKCQDLIVDKLKKNLKRNYSDDYRQKNCIIFLQMFGSR